MCSLIDARDIERSIKPLLIIPLTGPLTPASLGTCIIVAEARR